MGRMWCKTCSKRQFFQGFNNNDNDNKDNKNNNGRFFVLKYQFFWYLQTKTWPDFTPKIGEYLQPKTWPDFTPKIGGRWYFSEICWFNQQLPLDPLEPMEKMQVFTPSKLWVPMGSSWFPYQLPLTGRDTEGCPGMEVDGSKVIGSVGYI